MEADTNFCFRAFNVWKNGNVPIASQLWEHLGEIGKIAFKAVGLIDDLQPHLAGGASDNAEGGFVVARV